MTGIGLRCGLGFSLFTLILASGCGGEAPKRPLIAISGNVTLDGNPLKQGNIAFEPMDGKGSPSQGAIADGKFSTTSEMGAKRVRIYSTQKTGEKDQYGSEVSVELIPTKYNSESTLNADVSKSGPNQFKYELSTAP